MCVLPVGTGTFGRVVLCEDNLASRISVASVEEEDEERSKPRSGGSRFYAMKILRIIDIFRLKQVEHIKDEKKILAGLDHPFIVKMCVSADRLDKHAANGDGTVFCTKVCSSLVRRLWSHHDSTNLYMLLEYAAGSVHCNSQHRCLVSLGKV